MILPLEKQVVSLKLAKELKENGYPQKEGLWWWSNCWRTKAEIIDTNWYLAQEKKSTQLNVTENVFVAPTVAELGEALSEGLAGSNKMAKGGWRCEYEPLKNKENEKNIFIQANTEANARAKCWLYLKKEKLL